MEDAVLDEKHDDDDEDEDDDDDEEAADMEEFEESGLLDDAQVKQCLNLVLLIFV